MKPSNNLIVSKFVNNFMVKYAYLPTYLHILKSSASMYESSGSPFFRTTTWIQSGPDAFDESRFVLTFLTILGLIEILCSFRLEGKKQGLFLALMFTTVYFNWLVIPKAPHGSPWWKGCTNFSIQNLLDC